MISHFRTCDWKRLVLNLLNGKPSRRMCGSSPVRLSPARAQALTTSKRLRTKVDRRHGETRGAMIIQVTFPIKCATIIGHTDADSQSETSLRGRYLGLVRCSFMRLGRHTVPRWRRPNPLSPWVQALGDSMRGSDVSHVVTISQFTASIRTAKDIAAFLYLHCCTLCTPDCYQRCIGTIENDCRASH